MIVQKDCFTGRHLQQSAIGIKYRIQYLKFTTKKLDHRYFSVNLYQDTPPES